jgi:hypothetical protein
MSVTGAISGYISLTDSVSGTTALQKPFVNLQYTGTNCAYVQSQVIGTTTVTFTLPVSPVQFLYFKNVTTGSGTITVTWTPNGGSSNPVLTLQPGSDIQFTEAASGAGITGFQVVASTSNTNCEYILLG